MIISRFTDNVFDETQIYDQNSQQTRKEKGTFSTW